MAERKKVEEKLTDVLDTMVEYYKTKLQNGDLSASEQKNVIQLLRDNNVTVDPSQVDPLEAIASGDLSGIDWEEYVKE